MMVTKIKSMQLEHGITEVERFLSKLKLGLPPFPRESLNSEHRTVGHDHILQNECEMDVLIGASALRHITWTDLAD